MINNLFRLCAAMRLYRMLPVLMVMLIPTLFSRSFPPRLLLLGASCLLLYGGVSIHNFVRDRDARLPRQASSFAAGCVLFSLLIATFHLIVLLTTLAWLALGYFYNTFSRRLLMGDSTILTFTHFGIPAASSSSLLGVSLSVTAAYTAFLMATAWFIMPLKNLKGIREDRERGYRTLPVVLKKRGERITLFLFVLSFPLIASAYILFPLSALYLGYLVLLFALMMGIVFYVQKRDIKHAYRLSRTYLLLFLLGFFFSTQGGDF